MTSQFPPIPARLLDIIELLFPLRNKISNVTELVNYFDEKKSSNSLVSSTLDSLIFTGCIQFKTDEVCLNKNEKYVDVFLYKVPYRILFTKFRVRFAKGTVVIGD